MTIYEDLQGPLASIGYMFMLAQFIGIVLYYDFQIIAATHYLIRIRLVALIYNMKD